MLGKEKKSNESIDATALAPASAAAESTTSGTTTPGSTTPTPSITKDIAPDGKTPDDSSKLRTFLSILRRFIGVTDIAAVRFSLPAQLLEPIPNLEYWHYLDRPETFVAIGDSEDALGRMLACLRFWFTKDLKYVHGKPCKPYNSTLGEFFRCQWEVKDDAPALIGQEKKVSAEGASTKDQPIKVSFLCEQTSHHPPVSAYYVDCPAKGISARGFDQLSAKFTGTSIKVTPGDYNEGIFIDLASRGEHYHLSHPAAFLGGFLRGNLSVTVADTCFVTCAETGLKVLLHYVEEGYFGKTQNKIEGVVFKCDVASDSTTRLKDVPESAIVGRIEGVWTERIFFSPGSTEFKKSNPKDRILLVDVVPLRPVPKTCPPLEQQLPNESRLFWNEITEAIAAKQFALATTKKQEIEERQRERAAARKATQSEWTPRFFVDATEPVGGKPGLTELGRKTLQGMIDGQYELEPPAEYGAI